MTDSIRAHAKVNLHLEVLNRRDDGYHAIVSLMASVALHDLLKLDESTVREFSGGIDIAVAVRSAGGTHGGVIDAIPAHENLIARAATLYCQRAGLNGTAAYSIVKNIPAGAGLGGGSSDAAAALKLINGRLGRFTDEDLAGIGVMIGADVPYCLTGGFAICRGIGEIIMPVPGKLNSWVLVINDGIHVDTGAAYRSLQRGVAIDTAREAEVGKTIRRLTAALFSGSLEELKETVKNDFETPVFSRHPLIGRIKEELYGCGAGLAIMTGSGSSVVGLFAEKDAAERAQARLGKKYREAILTRFV